MWTHHHKPGRARVLLDQLLLGMSQGPVRDKRTQEPMVILAGIAAFESWLPNIFSQREAQLLSCTHFGFLSSGDLN